MNFNPDTIVEFARAKYLLMILREHGEKGISVLKDVLTNIRKIFEYINPDDYKEAIFVFKTLDDTIYLFDTSEAICVTDFSTIIQDLHGVLIFQILHNGQLLLWQNKEPNIQEIAKKAVLYKYSNSKECFYANSCCEYIPKLCSSYASNFSIPTFNELKDALNQYKIKMVRYSSCKIFANVWFETNRLFFKNAPEETMRTSLVQFLKSCLRADVEVRPEQNVDETHPVDIKVTWTFTNRLALIEIKWLGTPKYKDGHLGKKYGTYRAKEGAKQLANYLDMNKVQAPSYVTKGYLVIIDGRRAGLKSDTTFLDTKKGLYYRDKEIVFNPKFHEIRDDFEKPIRMFSEPICQ